MYAPLDRLTLNEARVLADLPYRENQSSWDAWAHDVYDVVDQKYRDHRRHIHGLLSRDERLREETRREIARAELFAWVDSLSMEERLRICPRCGLCYGSEYEGCGGCSLGL